MREFGIENFADEVVDGEHISPESADLLARGIYLIHNGNDPDGFMNMTPDEVQLMYTTEIALRKQQSCDILKGIVAIINKLGENDGR